MHGTSDHLAGYRVRQEGAKSALPSQSRVVFAEMLPTPKGEMGAVIRPFWPGKVSLERERRYESPAVAGIVPPPFPLLAWAYTGVTLDP
jgi:hypothetical protein